MDKPTEGKNESQERLFVLRKLIREGTASTQEDLVKALRQKKFVVTQSTISRDLRRIGAIKATNPEGQTIYRLPDAAANLPLNVSHSLGGLLLEIQSNENMVVIHTTPGSASLVARHLDSLRTTLGILGTIAGDDTIFLAPASVKQTKSLIKRLKEEF